MGSPVGLNQTELFPYYDDMHFPYGFARSGYFTKKQAEILTSYGRHLRALWAEDTSPSNAIEENFVLVCQGLKEATNDIETAWLAYLNAINQVTGTRYTTYWDEITHFKA
jgi:uncharacterized protein YifE (UPF0438 family)